MRRRLIGFAGRSGHGKDTAGSVLVAHGWQRVAFADPLKAIVADLWDMTHDQMHGVGREVIDPRWGLTPREILQRFGAAARDVHPDTWVRRALRGLPDRAVVTDVRYPNEARAIQEQGGRVVLVHRPGVPPRAGSHLSERAMDGYPVDAVLRNDSTLDVLARRVLALTEAP